MKIALLGYGKMGKEIEQIALQRKHEIVLKVDINNASSFSSEELKKADVAIEFSTPESAFGNIMKCFDLDVPIVVGSTGWLNKLEEAKKICLEKNKTLFYASNYSIGVNIFFKLNQYLAKIMNAYPEYNISMMEEHHIHKLDTPSGTAITLAEQIISNNDLKEKWVNTETGKAIELEIISKRIAEVPGTHTVKYFSPIDEIEITHLAHSRKGFALGAVLAAEWIKNKKGIFGMNNLLNI